MKMFNEQEIDEYISELRSKLNRIVSEEITIGIAPSREYPDGLSVKFSYGIANLQYHIKLFVIDEISDDTLRHILVIPLLSVLANELWMRK